MWSCPFLDVFCEWLCGVGEWWTGSHVSRHLSSESSSESSSCARDVSSFDDDFLEHLLESSSFSESEDSPYYSTDEITF